MPDTAVDVQVRCTIRRPRAEVAAYAGDPTNAPEWYVNITSVRWRTDPPVSLGSQLDFVARFLGRRISYTYEIVDLVPNERLVMRTADGPFPMETTYTWADTHEGTVMTVRNRGNPRGLLNVAAPLVEGAVRRATSKDLVRLREILEEAT